MPLACNFFKLHATWHATCGMQHATGMQHAKMACTLWHAVACTIGFYIDQVNSLRYIQSGYDKIANRSEKIEWNVEKMTWIKLLP
jgi:hypothetical protein